MIDFKEIIKELEEIIKELEEMEKEDGEERCENCVCLIEKDKRMFCDEYNDFCSDIETCGEWEK